MVGAHHQHFINRNSVPGSTLSTKYVGVFVFVYVGLSTVHQLWSILGDRNIKPVQFIAHFLARSFALILVPILVYVAAFYLHFLVLTAEGPGTTYYHPNFQVYPHIHELVRIKFDQKLRNKINKIPKFASHTHILPP